MTAETVQPSLLDADEDQLTRISIATALDTTLFVEAGAGSGKTKSLVDRVVALITVEGVPMREIVAVTFTDKAAAELRDRIRCELERVAGAHADEPAVSQRAMRARDELDAAAVSTLHAFARRILSEHAIEAGLPPRIEVLDDVESQIAFDERWTRFLDAALDDHALERALLLGISTDITRDTLRSLAVACNANWDLVAERIGPEPDPPPMAIDALVAVADAVVGLADQCTDGDDKLVAELARLHAWRGRLRSAPDEYEQLRMLGSGFPRLRTNVGQKGNWPSHCDVGAVRERIGAVKEAAEALRRTTAEGATRRLMWEIAQFTLREAASRRRSGELEFHDLLVLSRSLLRDPEHGWDVRRRLRARYTRFLLDEFQDTDPIQCDLAALLASPEPDARDHRWNELVTDPGRLFVVGDPKQSIYRFRRADIAAFLRARSAFGATPHRLTRNYRSTPPIIEFVNHVFRDLIVADAESQPEYVALRAARTDMVAGAPVVLLGAGPHDDRASADVLREREAADVAAVIASAIAEGWEVARRRPDGTLGAERCRLGDICVLLPARTSLSQLEDALDAAGIPYRAETSSLVYSTREIRDLLMVLQAVDDPTDELALVSALRSPVLGCGDDDLYTFRIEHHGHWNHRAPLPDTLPPGHPVGDAMRCLAAWHDSRLWLSPSELLDRIVRERRVLEVGFAQGRPRDLWRRVRFVVEQARAFGEAASGSLRDFLHWADLQSVDGARAVETVLPETDDDAVRILTIHGAKGLEFPIVIVSGMTTKAAGRKAGVQLVFPHDRDTYALRISSRVVTEEFERYQPIDEQMDFHEKLRLLYVALTRARDHLVVSVHRLSRARDAGDRRSWTHAELLWSAAQSAPHWAPLDQSSVAPRVTADALAAEPGPPIPAWEEWSAERDRALTEGMRARTRSATAIAREAAARAALGVALDPGLAKDTRDLELPPWNKGRYGTAVGRAVHAVLQTVDLATGEGIEATAAAQAAAEGVIGREEQIAALARSALSTDIAREAVACGFRREMYVAAPVAGRTLEGYVDLVYRTGVGLVVVDYKTDVWHDERDLDEKVARYRLQGASYALALETVTGERVARCVFLFLRGAARAREAGGAQEREITDLRAAIEEVRALLAASA